MYIGGVDTLTGPRSTSVSGHIRTTICRCTYTSDPIDRHVLDQPAIVPAPASKGHRRPHGHLRLGPRCRSIEPADLAWTASGSWTDGVSNPMILVEHADAAMLCHRRSAETPQGY